jgi:hypothetical protein
MVDIVAVKKFQESNWDEISNKNFDVLVTNDRRDEILKEIGYSITESGALIDLKTKKEVCAEDGKKVNLKNDRRIALIQGSHHFARNVAGYSQILVDRGFLKILPKEE